MKNKIKKIESKHMKKEQIVLKWIVNKRIAFNNNVQQPEGYNQEIKTKPLILMISKKKMN